LEKKFAQHETFRWVLNGRSFIHDAASADSEHVNFSTRTVKSGKSGMPAADFEAGQTIADF
jgi:hypothetical protein